MALRIGDQPEPDTGGSPRRAAIALGSNLGDRATTLDEALSRLDRHPDIRVERRSRWIDSPPLILTADGPRVDASGATPAYLNGAAVVTTRLGPRGLLRQLHATERSLGRDRVAEPRWGSRTLDLDLLLFGGPAPGAAGRDGIDPPDPSPAELVDDEGLVIPHPAMLERLFVLEPLAEVAPGWPIPTANGPIAAADAYARLRATQPAHP